MNTQAEWRRMKLVVHPDTSNKERAACEVKFKLRFDREKRETVPVVSHTLGWATDGKDFRPHGSHT